MRSPAPAENVVSPSFGLLSGAGGGVRPARSGEEVCEPRTTNWDPPAAFSTTCSSAMSANRRSGFFSSMRRTMASSAAGTAGLRLEGAGGATFRCMWTSSPNPSETKGGCPVSISNKITPSE
jgi:hypothetical protein